MSAIVKHFASRAFWVADQKLPEQTRRLADKSFPLLHAGRGHPSLQFKRVGRYWSARIGLDYRALAVEVDDGFHWFWIGTHAE